MWCLGLDKNWPFPGPNSEGVRWGRGPSTNRSASSSALLARCVPQGAHTPNRVFTETTFQLLIWKCWGWEGRAALRKDSENDWIFGDMGELVGKKQHEKDLTHLHTHTRTHRHMHACTHTHARMHTSAMSLERQRWSVGLRVGCLCRGPGATSLHYAGYNQPSAHSNKQLSQSLFPESPC